VNADRTCQNRQGRFVEAHEFFQLDWSLSIWRCEGWTEPLGSVSLPINVYRELSPGHFSQELVSLVMARKMTRRRLIALVLIAIVSVWILVSGRLDRGTVFALGDAMDRRERLLATRYGVDCGRVRIHADPTEATKCVLRAEGEGRAFRVRYDILGYDSDVAGGLVRTPRGQVYALSFDGDPRGFGGTSFRRQRVDQQTCPEPIHLYVNPKGRLNCFTSQLVPPANLMSPNFEPY
jgi:hypothetical protein